MLHDIDFQSRTGQFESPDELEQIARLLLELDEFHHEASPSQFPIQPYEKRVEDLKSILKNGHVFFAMLNHEIIAFASVAKKSRHLFIEHFFVKPEFRHKKVGSELIDRIFEKFPSQDIYTSVYPFNKGAISFYEKKLRLSSLIFKR